MAQSIVERRRVLLVIGTSTTVFCLPLLASPLRTIRGVTEAKEAAR